MIGRTLAGRFRVTGFIGEGAMAAVYRGVQDAEPRDVAIKVLHPHLAGDEKLVRRFRREARAASRLRHPSTVQVLGHGVEGRIAFIVMELCEGMDVFELLELEERLSEARAARIVIQVCDALAAAHELGIVHRDLKPENVMLVPVDGVAQGAAESIDEVVKVLDFGIAKVVQQTSDLDHAPSNTGGSPLTNIGAAVGTPEYMSPEQCSGAAVDARSDLYACGVLLYQLVTGVPPFAANTVLEVMLKHLRDAPLPPSRLVPGLHSGLEATILRALAKKPDDRQRTARDLARELGVILPALEARDPAPGARHAAGGAGAPVAAAPRPAKTLVYGAAVDAGVVVRQNEPPPAAARSAPAPPRPVPRGAPGTPPPPERGTGAPVPSRPPSHVRQAPSRPPPSPQASSRPAPARPASPTSRPPPAPAASPASRPPPAAPAASRPPPAAPAASHPPPAAPAASRPPPAAPAASRPPPAPPAPAAAPAPSAPPAGAPAALLADAEPRASARPGPSIAPPSDNVFVDALPHVPPSLGSAPPAPPAPTTAPPGPPLRAIFAATFVIVLLAALAVLALARR